ncbi:hypothetical protein [Neptunicella marina]|uniref:Uncharacterized protein n=1 Tax=Neptunicella marina TaxID=2125989 RepID=A0A8J6IYC5_9ALTE|nr:hypothetical protein [Neptunicella marina]MBC3767368.1 hypothetical protein [Neptunicella marina]
MQAADIPADLQMWQVDSAYVTSIDLSLIPEELRVYHPLAFDKDNDAAYKMKTRLEQDENNDWYMRVVVNDPNLGGALWTDIAQKVTSTARYYPSKTEPNKMVAEKIDLREIVDPLPFSWTHVTLSVTLDPNTRQFSTELLWAKNDKEKDKDKKDDEASEEEQMSEMLLFPVPSYMWG